MNPPFTFHPLDRWPYPDTEHRRGRYTFRASYPETLELLNYELELLEASRVVLQANFRDRDIRGDGLPRADARQPEHPGVILSFESRHGPQRYATDAHDLWQHNVRGIALGLESLRAVDRYGITRSGEQYAGWKQLTAGSGITTRDAALELLRRLSGLNFAPEVTEDLRAAYRVSLKRSHPDTGGKTETFAAVLDAGRILGVEAQPSFDHPRAKETP